MKDNFDIEKLSRYFYLASLLITEYHFDSIFKISIISLILEYKKNDLSIARNKKDIIDIFFSSLRPILFSASKDFRYIFSSIDLLVQNNYIERDGDSISIVKKMNYIPSKIINGKTLSMCLTELSSLSIKSFVAEVLYYV